MDVRLPPFQTLLRDHAEEVYRFLAGMVGPRDADDCFQETVLAALRAYPGLRDATNLRGWMLTIAHSKAVDEHRARARRAVPVERVPERAVPGSNDGVALWDLVRDLPPKQRASVVHRYANELPYREIARILDVSEAAARQNVREGLKKLKEWV